MSPSSMFSRPGAMPCHEEQEFLLDLAADRALAAKGVRLIGVAQKDDPENVRRFLGAKGDPYAKVGLDRDGRAGIDWGVYGVPETFIVKGDGTVAFKFIGPMTAEALASVVKPQIEKAMDSAEKPIRNVRDGREPARRVLRGRPESGAKPPFHREREVALTGRRRRSRELRPKGKTSGPPGFRSRHQNYGGVFT